MSPRKVRCKCERTRGHTAAAAHSRGTSCSLILLYIYFYKLNALKLPADSGRSEHTSVYEPAFPMSAAERCHRSVRENSYKEETIDRGRNNL